MMVLRRIFAVLLAILVVITFIPVLVAYRVNSTVANPNFYVNQLRKADIYNFLYDDVLPAAASELHLAGNQTTTDFSWTAPYLTTALKETVPPEWLQSQTESAIFAVVPYMNGSRDRFVITIALKDRVEAGATAIKDLLRNDQFTPRLYDQGTSYFATVIVTKMNQSFLPLDEASARSLISGLMPVSWLVTEINGAITEVTPYFTGDQDHFVIRIEVASRLDDIKTVLVDILSRQESYDYIVNNVLLKAVTGGAPSGLEIIPGVFITADEIAPVVKQALPLDWYRGQVSSLVDQVLAYFKGTPSSLDITVSLADRKQAMTTALAGLVDRKLEQYYNSLPEGTLAQVIAFLANPPASGLPGFRLPGVSFTQLKQLVGINAETLLAPVLRTAIPDQLSLGGLLGAGVNNPLALARDYIQKGFTFSDQDLTNKFGSQKIENIRGTISSGVTFTDQDLREAISGDQGKGMEGLDQARSAIKSSRQVLLFLWILPLLLLAAIGFLGGRTWGSKLIWAAAALAVASLIVLIVAGPVFSALVQPQIDKLAQTSAAPGSLGALLAAKETNIAQNVVSSFIGGIILQAAVLLTVSVGLIIYGGVLHRRTAAPVS